MDTKERDAAVSPTTSQSGKEANIPSVPAGDEGVKLSFLELFERELEAHQITWCKGDNGCKHHHRRARASQKTRTVHMLDTPMRVRTSLFTGFHEIGHIVDNTPGMTRGQKEESANKYMYRRMKELGISIPRKVRKRYDNYVEQWKRIGKNVSAGLKKSAARKKSAVPKPPKSSIQTRAILAAKRAIARVMTEDEIVTLSSYLSYRRDVIRERQAKVDAAHRWESIRSLAPGRKVIVTRSHYSNLPIGTMMEVIGPKKKAMVLKWNDKNLHFGPASVESCGLEPVDERTSSRPAIDIFAVLSERVGDDRLMLGRGEP